MAALAIAGAVAGEKQGIVLLAGLLGMITYFLVNGLGNLFDVDEDGDVDAADADLVVHSGPSGTAQLAGKAALMLFLYLEVIDASFSFDHGAHWAIGALAVILLVTIVVPVNEIVTGLIGVVFIGAAFLGSVRRNKQARAAEQTQALEPANS
jgi:hypothetical protein